MPIKLEPDTQATCSSQFALTLPEFKTHIRPRQPTCRICDRVAIRKFASPLNTRNSGRPYYICPSCPWEDRWVCWEDTKGVSAGNPLCDCEEPSRLDIMGKSKGVKAGRGFWTCVTGRCWYYSENEEGTPGVSPDGGFYP